MKDIYIDSGKLARNGQKTSSQVQKNIFAFCVIEPIEVQTHSAPQNHRLNSSFVTDIYVDGRKLASDGRKNGSLPDSKAQSIRFS